MKQLVVYLRVDDRSYPRNERIRRAFVDRGFTVRVLDRSRGPKLLAFAKDLVSAWKASRGAAAVVVPEFSLPFVPLAWIVSRMRRCVLIVDGFVGTYETEIEDWGRASPRSLRALRCRMVDALAVRLADVYLIDTDARAARVRARARGRAVVASLPVGAPDWIRPQRPLSGGPLRVLYSGGALPLHGVPFLLRGLAATEETATTLTLVFAAPDARRQETQALAASLGIAERCLFVPAVPHHQLIRIVHGHDVVLGVFGDSPKARTVIANKVWQGLAAGRTVVTRSGPALEELEGPARELLVAVDDEDALGAALDRLARAEALPHDPSIADRLDAYVDRRYREFFHILEREYGMR